MAFRMGKAGPLVLAGIAIYIAVVVAQSRAAASLCDRYSVGTRIADVENLEGTFLLRRMGSIYPIIPGAQNVIFCAPLTMCDVSCSLEIENGLVTKSEHRRM